MEKSQAKAMIMERMGWDEAKFAENEQWAKDNCSCLACPSYVEDETELAFCWAAVGKSEVISEEQNCVCGQCHVFNQAKLKTAYYCTRDSELVQLADLAREAAA